MIIKFNCLLTIETAKQPRDYETYCIVLEQIIEKALQEQDELETISTAEIVIEEI